MKLQVLFFSVALAVTPISWAAPKTSAATDKDTSSTPVSSTKKVDLNTATRAELETLPGVGAATADAIIAARPFRSVEDLKNVKGIGEVRFAELHNQVTVSHKDVAHTSSGTSTATTDTRRNEPNRATTSAAGKSARIDLNSADATTLQTLPGVGAAIAQNIIAARPFRSVDDLKNVKGIRATRFEEIRPLVTVHASTRSGNVPSSGAAASTETSRGSAGKVSTSAGTALGKGAEQKTTGHTAETKINLNTASLAELEALPGIGPVKAQAIIDNRPYTSIEDVMKVKGIKEGTFAEIKDRIRVK